MNRDERDQTEMTEYLSMPNRAIEAAARRTVDLMLRDDIEDLATCSDKELADFAAALKRCAQLR